MAYGFAKPKVPPCDRPDAKDGKHKWTFVRNGVQKKGTDGIDGGSYTVSVKGLYKCLCGAQRVGQPNHNAEWPKLV